MQHAGRKLAGASAAGPPRVKRSPGGFVALGMQRAHRPLMQALKLKLLLLLPLHARTQLCTRDVGLVPIRIAVVVTLRELRPIHQSEVMQRDVAGQVRQPTNPRPATRHSCCVARSGHSAGTAVGLCFASGRGGRQGRARPRGCVCVCV